MRQHRIRHQIQNPTASTNCATRRPDKMCQHRIRHQVQNPTASTNCTIRRPDKMRQHRIRHQVQTQQHQQIALPAGRIRCASTASGIRYKTQQHQQIAQPAGRIRCASIASGIRSTNTRRLPGLARHNLDNLPIRLLHRMTCQRTQVGNRLLNIMRHNPFVAGHGSIIQRH